MSMDQMGHAARCGLSGKLQLHTAGQRRVSFDQLRKLVVELPAPVAAGAIKVLPHTIEDKRRSPVDVIYLSPGDRIGIGQRIRIRDMLIKGERDALACG